MSMCGERSLVMRKHREVYLLILLALAGCALFLGFFLLQNRTASVRYADLFSPGKEITHTELPPSFPAGPLVNINTALFSVYTRLFL